MQSKAGQGKAGQGSGRWFPTHSPLAFLSQMVLTRRDGNAPARPSPVCGLSCISAHTHTPTMASASALIYSLYIWLLSVPTMTASVGEAFRGASPCTGAGRC